MPIQEVPPPVIPLDLPEPFKQEHQDAAMDFASLNSDNLLADLDLFPDFNPASNTLNAPLSDDKTAHTPGGSKSPEKTSQVENLPDWGVDTTRMAECDYASDSVAQIQLVKLSILFDSDTSHFCRLRYYFS